MKLCANKIKFNERICVFFSFFFFHKTIPGIERVRAAMKFIQRMKNGSLSNERTKLPNEITLALRCFQSTPPSRVDFEHDAAFWTQPVRYVTWPNFLRWCCAHSIHQQRLHSTSDPADSFPPTFFTFSFSSRKIRRKKNRIKILNQKLNQEKLSLEKFKPKWKIKINNLVFLFEKKKCFQLKRQLFHGKPQSAISVED